MSGVYFIQVFNQSGELQRLALSAVWAGLSVSSLENGGVTRGIEFGC
ncbi:MAG: hypothetical protein MI976_23805 [Pseudomonadales bacterium]|nr:hypothetical protein [Pseudomonadales bacterium]